MMDPAQMHFSSWQQMLLSGAAVRRLLAACLCGGAIGTQRELRHKSSGLRTNILVAMGSALFTIMSAVLAGEATPDKGRVASNIVQGVGFLGAGLILHNRNRVAGLTSAATVFVVAAIGMTCGAGLYLEAAIATVLVLLALWGVGLIEFQLGWHRYPMVYEVRADVGVPGSGNGFGKAGAQEQVAAEDVRRRMYLGILRVLDGAGLRLDVETRENVAGLERVCFSVLATRGVHERLLNDLRASEATDKVLAFPALEDE